MKVLWDGTYGVSFLSHPRRPKGSQSGRGKRRDESSKAKAPRYRPSPDHFKTVKRMLAPHWAQLLSTAQSANSIAWVCLSVFVLDCYCLAIQYCTCPVRSRLCVQEKLSFSTLLTRKGTTDDSGKRSAEPFQFAPLSFFPPRPTPFSRTRHFLAFPTLSRLPHYPRAWNRLKSLKCWWGQCVLGMRAISRICTLLQ